MPMVDLNNLWIGDKLKLLSSKRIGTFQGINGTRARVKVGDKIILVKATGLELQAEKEEASPILHIEEEKEEKSQPLNFHNFHTTLDLHIEVLAPEMTTQSPSIILDHQLRKLKEYLDQAEKTGAKYLTIIHGKGTGVLKKEVEHLLSMRAEVQFVLEKHDGGAVEVHLY